MKELPADLDALSRDELLALVRTLAAFVDDLRAEIDRLKRAGKRQAAPFSKGERTKHPKRPGRKPGRGVFRHRTPPEPSELTGPPVEVPVGHACCPACGGGLEADGVERAWRTELPPLPRPEVTEYRLAAARCTACGERVRAEHPDVAADQRGATAHRLGPRLLATAHMLHYAVGVPLRRVPAVLRELRGVRVTQGALTQAALRESERGAGACYDALRAEVPEASACHTDGTGWRVGGERAQLAVFETEHATVYTIGAHHRNADVRAVIGDAYDGVLITDRGSVYDARALAAVRQQKCLAHVLRSISEVTERKRGRAKRFGLRLAALLREAIALWAEHRAGRADEAAYESEAERIRSEVTHHLRERRLKDTDNQRLLTELGWHHDGGNLLQFLGEPDIEPTNNRAERALRPAVIGRKVSQGSKTDRGADAYAIFCSLLRTGVQREVRSVTDALVRMLASGRPPPLPATT